jgi:hypothetical protein
LRKLCSLEQKLSLLSQGTSTRLSNTERAHKHESTTSCVSTYADRMRNGVQ